MVFLPFVGTDLICRVGLRLSYYLSRWVLPGGWVGTDLICAVVLRLQMRHVERTRLIVVVTDPDLYRGIATGRSARGCRSPSRGGSTLISTEGLRLVRLAHLQRRDAHPGNRPDLYGGIATISRRGRGSCTRGKTWSARWQPSSLTTAHAVSSGQRVKRRVEMAPRPAAPLASAGHNVSPT